MSYCTSSWPYTNQKQISATENLLKIFHTSLAFYSEQEHTSENTGIFTAFLHISWILHSPGTFINSILAWLSKIYSHLLILCNLQLVSIYGKQERGISLTNYCFVALCCSVVKTIIFYAILTILM